ncbi:hypothetical protein DFJ63DRAFT_318679 [Scheffersomyces coipomensis]|uniref:uncharacterized protein n=1 Tax=Scheffersomyces coipomensis TaxID=1788519 RepID=UPI00315D8C4A
MNSIRSFSTISRIQFESRSILNLYYSSANAAKLVKPKLESSRNSNEPTQIKWKPSNGDSFRSFAEYRLKVSNQSPLKVRAKDYISVRTTPTQT